MQNRREEEERKEKKRKREYGRTKPGPIRNKKLGITINRIDLETVYLDKSGMRESFYRDKNATIEKTKFVLDTTECNGVICPNFQKCLGKFAEKIEACWSVNTLNGDLGEKQIGEV